VKKIDPAFIAHYISEEIYIMRIFADDIKTKIQYKEGNIHKPFFLLGKLRDKKKQVDINNHGKQCIAQNYLQHKLTEPGFCNQGNPRKHMKAYSGYPKDNVVKLVFPEPFHS
jgi:hypothetical protein